MATPSETSVWTTAPERLFSDSVSPGSWEAERVREVLRIGLNALTPDNPGALILPPRRAYAPKRVGGRKDLHCHRYVEVGIVIRGEMTIWWEGVTQRCPAGSVFLIPPGTRYLPHVLDADKASPTHSIAWLALHRGCAVAHVCALEGKTHRLSPYYNFTQAQIMAQARNLAQELADRSPFHEVAIRGGLLCLFSWLLRAPVHPVSRSAAPTIDSPGNDTDPFQERVESYLLSHYHRPLTLLQVARSVGCSTAYLCRHYRKLTGKTPFQYLRDIRMEAAKRLLRSEVPIGRVAEMVGFDDPLYFSKVFSAQTGVSPQRFRTSQ